MYVLLFPFRMPYGLGYALVYGFFVRLWYIQCIDFIYLIRDNKK